MSAERRSPGELAGWMQEERRTLARLANVLKEHIAVVPEVNVATWLDGARAAFARLRQHLERVFAAQESGGYLQHVLEERPTLSGQLDQCRHEHGELLTLAGRIDAELADTRPEDQLLLSELAERIRNYLALVDEHDRRENVITQFVFNLDIGSGD